MSASIRFLGFAVLAWVGVRAASLAFYPPTSAVAANASRAAAIPPVAQTRFDPPPPPDPMAQQAFYPGQPGYWPPGYAPPGYGPPGYGPPDYGSMYPAAYSPPYGYPRGDRTIVIPASWPAHAAPRSEPGGWAGIMPTPRPLYAEQLSPGPWPEIDAPPASAARSNRGATPAFPSTPVRPPRFDRLQLTAWALLRGTGRGTIPTTSLASGGTLGGSQAGARLTWRFNQAWAASIRSSSSGGGVRGAEVAGGIRWQPFQSIPIAFTAERREGLGRFGGRSAFALFAEGGIYHRALFNKVYLDGYIQGGVVGFNNRDLFVDGGATLTRPIWRNISGGFGVWGAAQPGLYRLDAGPRISMQVRRGIKVHADYRQRLIGNAAPPSGPAITLAADF
ncbi:MAG: hypothetical protein LH485_04035 [Sphingomonas bacterium]|nr:hypothetical protein [Sphingomonas bacterium]